MDKDFEMCVDDECSSKHTCFRYTADPILPGQAFMAEGYRKDEEDKCKYWVSNRKRKNPFYKKVRDYHG